MDRLSLLRGTPIKINEHIFVTQPTVSEIASVGESAYFAGVYTLCATPSDYKVQLWDNGIDWTEVDDFVLFQTVYKSVDPRVIALLLPGVPLLDMVRAVVRDSNEMCLVSKDGNVVIDETVYLSIVDALRKSNSVSKNVDKPGNLTTKKFMLNKERRRIERAASESEKSSSLAPIISSLVNCEHFKYDYSSVWGLTLYQLMDALQQIQRYKRCDYTMCGVYAGTVDPKNLSSDDLSWIATSNKS
nr:MAG TPA: hypothetical protein [Caudoviricetes sp.]